MRTRYLPTRRRRVLCVSPRYAPSFGTFQYAYPFFGGRVRAFMPPQGLLVVASYLPETWDVRFVDENAGAASDADFQWADAVLVSGMHVQRAFINDIVARAHRHGRVVVLGGPSVSSCPEYYPEADLLHVGELGDATDQILAGGATSVYFVDDNFIGNQKATLELLPHLIEWQRAHRYPLRFACEATLNIAKNERVLALMREAGFVTIFCGIETPEPQALRFMSKDQNLRMPPLEAVRTLNRYGFEVVSGIIIGLDTDTPDTTDRIIDFVQASAIPILTINILYALPRTPLWRRLEAEGRLLPDEGRESNIAFRMPYESVLGMWLRCITTAYDPAAVYERYVYNVEHTFSNRLPFPTNRERASWRNVLMGLAILGRLFWRVGIRGDYRRTFWKAALPMLRAGELEALINTAVVSHHLIEFTRQCARGVRESSFYAPEAPAPPEAVAG